MIGLSGLGAGAAAIFVGGTILSPYTMQAYAAGGYSKSSFNNIHWDEKSARKWACYATAGHLQRWRGMCCYLWDWSNCR
ncbi:hypothetical protein [Leptospira interrogans]|uniref:hypothetical protein n=1 Tax=Leptospira interrogans TaxID=173 RepID=UPI0035CD2B22